MARFCEQCGEPLQPNENFCSNCGAKVIRDEPPEPSTTSESKSTSVESQSTSVESQSPPKPSPSPDDTQKRVAEFYAKKKSAAQKPPPVKSTHVESQSTSTTTESQSPPLKKNVLYIGLGIGVLIMFIFGMVVKPPKSNPIISMKPVAEEKLPLSPLSENDFTLAGLTLGMSRNEVENKFYTPLIHRDDYFKYENIEVRFENGLVASITCTNANSASRGIRIGDYLSEVEDAYGKNYSHDKDGTSDVYTYTLGNSALSFVFDDKKISRIVVHRTTSTPVTFTVPNVVGKFQSDAANELQNAGFEVKFSETYSDSVPSGKIISQSPNSGAEIAKGQTIYVYVSKGVDPAKNNPPPAPSRPNPPPSKPANDDYNYSCQVDGATIYKGISRRGVACALYDWQTQKQMSFEYLGRYTARGTFYFVTAIVSNNTNSPIIRPSLYLVDDSGRKYTSNDNVTSSYLADRNIEIEFELNPGTPQFYYEIFDIPEGANITNLRCEAIDPNFDEINFNVPFRIVTE